MSCTISWTLVVVYDLNSKFEIFGLSASFLNIRICTCISTLTLLKQKSVLNMQTAKDVN